VPPAGAGPAQFNTPEAIAIDNSSGPSKGDVYVVSDRLSSRNVIEKFTSTGAPLGRLSTPEAFGIGGVAVDSSGIVWVWEYEGPAISSFTDALVNVPLARVLVQEGETEQAGGINCAVPGFAVDANGEALYVNHQREDFEEECPEVTPSAKNPAVVGKLRVSGEPPTAFALIQALDVQNSSAVAVDLSSGKPASGDVYVDNETNVAAFTAAGSLIQRFGQEGELTKGRGVAVDPQREEVLVADSGQSRVAVFGPAPEGAPMIDSVSSQNLTPTSTRLEAQIDANGLDTHYYFQYGTDEVCGQVPSSFCATAPLPPPGADIGSAFGDVHVEATLTGLESGTTYFFRVVAENEGGTAENGPQMVDTFTTLPNPVGLLSDGRAWELVSPPDKAGSGIEAIGGSSGPSGGIMEASEDGKAITYVANGPIEADPEGSHSPEGTQVIATRGSEAWASKDIVTPSRQGEGAPFGSTQEYQLFSADLSFALLQPYGLTNLQEPPLVPGVEQEERGIYRRSNATCQATPATCYQPLITAENNTAEAKQAWGGEAVGHFSGTNGVVSGTPDLSHVVFSSHVALTGPKPKAPELELNRLYEWSAASAPAEQLQLVSVLPEGTASACTTTCKTATHPVLGTAINTGTAVRNAVSGDGSRVFWTQTGGGESEETGSLYVRETRKGETLRLDVPKLSQAEEEEGLTLPKLSKKEEEAVAEPRFQTASTDGSRVFFTDTVSLTGRSRLRTKEEGPADLYVCDVVEVEEKLHCNLTDLTVDPRSDLGESAGLVGVALGASDDGSSIYFVANGVLSNDARSHGATVGHCRRPNSGVPAPPDAECNLYLEQYNGETKTWEAPRFIAALSQDDAPDWNGSGARALISLTARVSPNGQYLAFMSNRSLTGYDNVDASEAAKGARDEEVFLYDAQSRRLVCASCKPGTRPHGVFDTEHAGEGGGLLVDRPHIWGGAAGSEVAEKWLAGSIPGWTPLEENTAPYQSRYLSDDGRLFFNGADALVPQDTNGKEDVYQFEPGGVGDCKDTSGCVALLSSGISPQESAFLDASPTGNDVFFVTAAQLISTDVDKSFDVYDARVCTESSPCLKPPPPPPPPCASEASCRPPAPGAPGFEAPPSATFSGPGNVAKQETLAVTPKAKSKPLTKAQKLAKALKSCRKKFKHAKTKRVACEKQARKKYGTKKAVKHGTGKKK
jgi:DNA-binding beta-propeller fold protein YncE